MASPPLEAESAPPAESALTYTVSVRSLCEFTAKEGDLDRRFTPSATALEGQQGEAIVVSRRGPPYESQIRLERWVGALHVRGRADGFDPRAGCLEEIKTIRGPVDSIPANRRLLHWAQLQCYGALFCAARGLDEIDLVLVYFDIDSQQETPLRERFGAAQLEAVLLLRCEQFTRWAQQESRHRAARDAALRELAFPLKAFRPGQRALSRAVYRAATNGHSLLAQAPTGIGKTMGTLYPALRAMPEAPLDKIAYLTCKNTARGVALQALSDVRATLPDPSLRVLDVVAKAQACVQPGKACHGDSCPLAQGFYDRLPAARQAAADAQWLDAPAQARIARDHDICPYYLGQEMLRWADVVVGDVHHVFDAHGQIFRLMQALEWRLGVLVDEGHNLIERARGMYGAALSTDQIDAAMPFAPASVVPHLEGLESACRELADSGNAERSDLSDSPDSSVDTVPERFADALAEVNTAIGQHLQKEPLTQNALLDFYFASLQMQRRVESFDSHSLFDIEAADAGAGTTFHIRCVVPAPFLKPKFEACRSVTVFSATLGSPQYQQDMLGLPPDTPWLDVPPVFAAEHLQVQVAALSTAYRRRHHSLDALVDVIGRQCARHPGNYLAFFSSFDYLAQAADRLAVRWPGLAVWRQVPSMAPAARASFLGRFVPDGHGVGLAVLGGAFAEGVDLPGTRLIGAFIATLGLPPVSPLQDRIRAQLDSLFGPDHGYADLVPGLQKVVQAAGRVLRTPEDRGWLWLIDERYAWPQVANRLPPAWRLSAAT